MNSILSLCQREEGRMATKLTSLILPAFPASSLPLGRNRHRKLQPLITCHSTSFSSSLGTDLPLRQHPDVSFQSYLQDRQRVFEALFPDKRRAEKLNDKEWRIYMIPLDFFFLTVSPVVDMRIDVQPPSSGLQVVVLNHVDRVLTLEATRCELRGLDYVLKPSDFVLSIKGVLFSEQRGMSSRMRGHLQMSVRLVIPSSLSLIPDEIVKNVGEAVLNRLLESMKERVNSKLLEDYRAYAQEKGSISKGKQTASPV